MPETQLLEEVIDLTDVERIIAKTGTGPEAVIPILQAIQSKYRYLPQPLMERVCELTEISPASIEGVATFYHQFRRTPVGKHVISVCDGTACHVKGAVDVHEALDLELGIEPGNDTDPDRKFTIRRVACIGCCSLAPAMQIDGVTYAHLSQETLPSVLLDFDKRQDAKPEDDDGIARVTRESGAEIRVGLDSCCVASGSDRIEIAVQKALKALGSDVPIKHVSCVHMCHRVPVIEIVEPDKEPTLYTQVKEIGRAHV